MTHIWYEIFPITIVGKNAMLLQNTSYLPFSPWMLPHQPHIHPNKLVIKHLTDILGGLPYTEKTIVHSTSWRYEAETDRMLMTYLAIFPQKSWIEQQSITSQLVIKPIGEIMLQIGDHLFPPEQIEFQHVLAHALDHLASLNTYDQEIQAALETGWQEILRPRLPKPAGCLQRTPYVRWLWPTNLNRCPCTPSFSRSLSGYLPGSSLL
jgi:hypothetical protein